MIPRCRHSRIARGVDRPPQDQVLRNQSVGSRCSVAASGPRLVTVIRIKMSSARLGVLDVDVEVAILVEDPGVDRARIPVDLACGAGSPRRAP